MVRAEITKKDGTKIIIDGSEEEVRKMLGVISLEGSSKKSQKQIKKKGKNNESKMSISDLLDELKEEGFFKEPKGLIEIKNALVQKGFIYPMSTLSGKVIRKIRKRELGRIKEDKKWKYVQR